MSAQAARRRCVVASPQAIRATSTAAVPSRPGYPDERERPAENRERREEAGDRVRRRVIRSASRWSPSIEVNSHAPGRHGAAVGRRAGLPCGPRRGRSRRRSAVGRQPGPPSSSAPALPAGRRVGRVLHRPPDDPRQVEDRNLQDHQEPEGEPEHGPSVPLLSGRYRPPGGRRTANWSVTSSVRAAEAEHRPGLPPARPGARCSPVGSSRRRRRRTRWRFVAETSWPSAAPYSVRSSEIVNVGGASAKPMFVYESFARSRSRPGEDDRAVVERRLAEGRPPDARPCRPGSPGRRAPGTSPR